jgi:DNA-binding ferritin-like protein
MSIEQEIKKLEKKIGEIQTKRDRAVGSLENYKKELKEKFDCDTVRTARELLEEYKTKEEKMEKSIRAKIKKAKEQLDEIGQPAE